MTCHWPITNSRAVEMNGRGHYLLSRYKPLDMQQYLDRLKDSDVSETE
jgi:hypothetical protein